jgi:predicted RNA-binding protein YlqC (UPF0109 family)
MQTVPDPNTPPAKSSLNSPDYSELTKFLVKPFLESPDSLKIDCETSPRTSRVLIRLAFEGEDKGRVFGRGGRNIQAIRTVLQAVAQTAGQFAHLEVFGSQSVGREMGGDDRPASPNHSSSRSHSRRPNKPRSR